MIYIRWGKSFVVCTFIMVLIFVSGCGKSNTSGTAEESGGEITEFNFPTSSTTSTVYPLGAGIANLWNKAVDDINVNAQASNGGVDNLNLLKDGEGHISFATAGIVWEAYNGERSFKDRPYEDVRVVAGLYNNPNQIVVRKDSGIDSIADLKDKRFAPGAVGGTPEVESSIILPKFGIEYPDDIKANFIGFTEATDLMRNNQIDGALIQSGLPTAAVTEMLSTADGKLIGIEPEIRKSLMEEYPWYLEMTIPGGTYVEQEEDVDTLAIKMLLITDASIDDDIIYKITKEFWENIDELRALHPVFEHVDIENAVTDLADIPLHTGAERYYDELGLLN